MRLSWIGRSIAGWVVEIGGGRLDTDVRDEKSEVGSATASASILSQLRRY
jgi:hypothetical protein